MNYTAVPTGVNWWYYCVSKSDLNGEVGSCASSNYPLTLIPATVQNDNQTVTHHSLPHTNDRIIAPIPILM